MSTESMYSHYSDSLHLEKQHTPDAESHPHFWIHRTTFRLRGHILSANFCFDATSTTSSDNWYSWTSSCIVLKLRIHLARCFGTYNSFEHKDIRQTVVYTQVIGFYLRARFLPLEGRIDAFYCSIQLSQIDILGDVC